MAIIIAVAFLVFGLMAVDKARIESNNFNNEAAGSFFLVGIFMASVSICIFASMVYATGMNK